MLILRTGALPAARLDLGSGATARVRPATDFEVSRASFEVSQLIAGLMIGEEAAAAAALALGEEFRSADFTDAGWRSAAAQRLSLLKLAVLCTESWEGIGDEDGAPLELSEPALALLLRDANVARKFGAAIEAAVHQEYKEKNASAASPNGGAGEGEPTAPNAGDPTSDAPRGSAASTASAAPKPSMLQ